ncbi:proline dehydrogenase family protein [Oceanobacillus chungangensis]|uniref:proline dehydrogenase n=1 Tax=Oceanobacillus chungangensis TaxID=1229152 RepID=A0A3D8PVS5_9BACI|nr:proline dehydrogenase family protein [Oceanobacillus chungangensis]RDW19378.1 proline dehydrogenase [Oceanobacillus chungangensis]
MANVTRDFFIGLSNNKCLNDQAKKWGFRLGAEKFVAGTNIESVTKVVKDLNRNGISCTIDNLGEYISVKSEATAAKQELIKIIEKIHVEKLDCHISVKLTLLGLDIDRAFCIDNIKEVLDVAKEYNVFVNFDMEDYSHYEQTMEVLHLFKDTYPLIGTVIQSYLYRAADDLEGLEDTRIRLVKGAYKEAESVAYQSKEEIDRNFIQLAKERLLGDAFTSIATHDHHIINELKMFIADKKIDKSKFEFQMLYGFRTEMQYELAEEGYPFCTYIPFGTDWFAYFMRRLAERPQNMNLVLKDVFYTNDDKLKRRPIILGGIALSSALMLLRKRQTRRRKAV